MVTCGKQKECETDIHSWVLLLSFEESGNFPCISISQCQTLSEAQVAAPQLWNSETQVAPAGEEGKRESDVPETRAEYVLDHADSNAAHTEAISTISVAEKVHGAAGIPAAAVIPPHVRLILSVECAYNSLDVLMSTTTGG